jgi:hypothetical protein
MSAVAQPDEEPPYPVRQLKWTDLDLGAWNFVDPELLPHHLERVRDRPSLGSAVLL